MSDIIAREGQLVEQDAIIQLFRIDLSKWGAGQVCFTPDDNGEVGVWFDGVEYHPLDCKLEGVEFSNQGTSATQQLSIPALYYTIMAQIAAADDLVGAPITITTTRMRCLDGQPDGGNAEAEKPMRWIISQMTDQTDTWVVFSLRAPSDQVNAYAPDTLVLRSCAHRYRYYNSATGKFDYSNATCPYAGDACYDRSGARVDDPKKDACSLQYGSGCKARYGNGKKPFLGSPSIRNNAS